MTTTNDAKPNTDLASLEPEGYRQVFQYHCSPDNAYQDSGASPPVTPKVDVAEAGAHEVAPRKKEPQSAITPHTSKQPPKLRAVVERRCLPADQYSPDSCVESRGGTELTASDLAAFERLRIGAELLDQAHVRRVTDQEARDVYGVTGSVTMDMSGIVFPYFSVATGARVTARLRRDNPEIEEGKEKNKYVSAYGDHKHLFFPPGAADKLQDPGTPIVLVEAEKSALALTAWTERTGWNLLAVATGGCWGWRGRIGKLENAYGKRVDEKGPISDLSCCDGRKVYVLLDANVATNHKVQQARAALTRELKKRSSEVFLCNLLSLDGVNGPDDYIAVCGDEAIQQVLETAQPALDVAVADAEAAIEAVCKANAECKVGETVRAMDAVADVSDDLRREFLMARLAATTRGSFSKKTITDGVAERLRKTERERADCAQRLEYAAAGPIDGAQVAETIAGFFRRYFVLDEMYFTILAIWALHTHVFEAFDYTPYLSITSPTKRCAKSNLCSALGVLVARPWKTQSVSVAALARKIEKEHCTMILDEADQAFKGPAEYTSALQGVLNSGFEQGGTYSRCVGEGASLESKDFSTFCPKAIAAIKRLPDTVTDRSIPLRIQRKGNEQVERFRSRKYKPEGAVIKKQAEIWAAGVRADIAFHQPQTIEELNDRAWDVCESLMAIAEHIGQGWDVRLRAALLKTFGSESAEDDETGVQLLRDTRDAIGEDEDKIFSTDLLSRLKSIETSPWADWNGGRGLSTNTLGQKLKDFDIRPKKIRMGEKTLQGYLRESFEDAWNRYLVSPVPSSDFQTEQPEQPNNDAGETLFSRPEQEPHVPVAKNEKSPINTRVVPDVPDENLPEVMGHNDDDLEGTL